MTGRTLTLSALVALTQAKAIVTNHCPHDVYIWSIPQVGSSHTENLPVKSGGRYEEPWRYGTSTNPGISIKISPEANGIYKGGDEIDFAYSVSKTNKAKVWIDLSSVRGKAFDNSVAFYTSHGQHFTPDVATSECDVVDDIELVLCDNKRTTPVRDTKPFDKIQECYNYHHITHKPDYNPIQCSPKDSEDEQPEGKPPGDEDFNYDSHKTSTGDHYKPSVSPSKMPTPSKQTEDHTYPGVVKPATKASYKPSLISTEALPSTSKSQHAHPASSIKHPHGPPPSFTSEPQYTPSAITLTQPYAPPPKPTKAYSGPPKSATIEAYAPPPSTPKKVYAPPPSSEKLYAAPSSSEKAYAPPPATSKKVYAPPPTTTEQPYAPPPTTSQKPYVPPPTTTPKAYAPLSSSTTRKVYAPPPPTSKEPYAPPPKHTSIEPPYALPVHHPHSPPPKHATEQPHSPPSHSTHVLPYEPTSEFSQAPYPEYTHQVANIEPQDEKNRTGKQELGCRNVPVTSHCLAKVTYPWRRGSLMKDANNTSIPTSTRNTVPLSIVMRHEAAKHQNANSPAKGTTPLCDLVRKNVPGFTDCNEHILEETAELIYSKPCVPGRELAGVDCELLKAELKKAYPDVDKPANAQTGSNAKSPATQDKHSANSTASARQLGKACLSWYAEPAIPGLPKALAGDILKAVLSLRNKDIDNYMILSSSEGGNCGPATAKRHSGKPAVCIQPLCKSLAFGDGDCSDLEDELESAAKKVLGMKIDYTTDDDVCPKYN